MGAPRRRRRRIDWRVVQRVQDEALKPAPMAAKQLHAKLEVEFADAAPSLRTVQQLYREFQPAEPGRWWSFGDDDPEDAALILPVLEALWREGNLRILLTEGPIRAEEARWIVRVRTAAPTMEPLVAFEFARRFAFAEQAGHDSRLLTVALALGVWRSPADEKRAIAENLLPEDWAYVGPERRLP